MKIPDTARLLLAIFAMAGLSGCVALLIHAGERAYLAGRKPAAAPPAPRLPAAADRALQDALRHGAPGLTAIVMRNGRVLLREDLGGIDPAAQFPVASASKWMTAALVMTVVDEGKLSLDAPISRYLPTFTGAPGRITLRQLLAQTSGEGGLLDGVDLRQDPRITLAASADAVARRPLQDPPGTVFRYGGPGFQVAGAAVEAVTGERWSVLFDRRIAAPLGMTHTYWEHLPTRGVSPSDTLDPLLQGGVVTTAQDYARFLTMLAQGGSVGGKRILSAGAVDAMETVQTLGLRMAYTSPGAEHRDLQYALGNWCERWSADRRCTLVSSPGAFGTYPWIDRQSGLYGIFFTRVRLPRIVDDLVRAREAILEAYAGGGRRA
jgi:CubicO group peptidase (beta-lactamase class C family)